MSGNSLRRCGGRLVVGRYTDLNIQSQANRQLLLEAPGRAKDL